MEALVPVIIPSIFVSLLMLERIRPARELPRVRFWLAKGIGFFFLIMAVNGGLPMLLAPLLQPHALFHLDWGFLPSALVTLVVMELFTYWIHRVSHTVPALWRFVHQMHHSAERIDIAGSVYFHPNEMLLSTTISTLAVALLGVSGEAAALAGLLQVFAGIFQHLNVKTPVWLGWIIQRPEGHSVHHQRGVHAYNYGNYSLWDLVFGTWRNPAEFSEQAGFWDGASSEVGAMLLGRDVVDQPRPSLYRTSEPIF